MIERGYRRCADAARSVVKWGFRQCPPGTRIRSEDAIRLAGSGQYFVAFVDGDILLRVDCGGQGGELVLNPASEGIGVAIEVYGFGACLGEELAEFCECVALTDDEAAAESFQIPREDFQRTAKELLARGAGPWVMAAPLAKDVHGDDLASGLEGGVQGGVVVKAKIATKPMNDALHGLTGWRRSEKRD